MNTCPNCGKHLEENETVCPNCGVDLMAVETETPQTQIDEPVVNNTGPYKPKRFVSKMNYGPQIFKDDDEFYLLDVYIASNIPKLKNGFSWNTFFFSFLYMFYRKMWILGIITIIFQSALFYFVPEPKFAIAGVLIYDIIMGLKFKDLYLKKALSTIEEIRKENPKKTDEELVPIVKEKGGTSLAVLIIVFIGSIISIILYGVLIFATIKSASGFALDYIKETLYKSKDSADKIEDLMRQGKEVNVAGKLYVIFPSGYTKGQALEADTFVFTNKQNCTVTIQTTPAYTFANSTDTYMDIKIKSSTVNQNVEYKNASYHGQPWRYARIENPQAMVYTTVYEDLIYDVTVSSDVENTTCLLNAETLALSFKFKEKSGY